MTSALSMRGNKYGASEKAIHAAVIDHWRICGVPGSLVATIPNEGAKGQPGLRRGLADLLVIAPGLPVGFLELKRIGGLLTEDQADFGQLCAMQRIPWAVSYGRDEPIAILEQWGVVRKSSDG